MARRRGTYTLSSNIELEAGAPLDSRDIVQTKADLTNGSFPYVYVGMETYVISEGKKYRFIGEDPTDIEDWEEVGSGDSDLEFIEISEADYAELTTEEKNDPTKIYFRYEATGFFRDVQDDPNATAFQGTKIPTGRTVDSVVDGKLDAYMEKGIDYVTAGQKADTVKGQRVTIEGGNNTASGDDSHAEGWETTASGGNAHSEGQQTVASAYNTHAEGRATTASAPGAHSEGYNTTASGEYSHSEGRNSSAVAAYSHAEGSSTVSSINGTYAHAEGQNCSASASGAHAEGWNTEAVGAASHVEGAGTIARLAYQHVQGKYNIPDTDGLYAHIVGGGAASYNRSNIHTLDWSGNAWFAGDVTDGSGNVLSDKADNEPTFSEASTRANIASGESIPTILGKIKKFFTDLKAVAFSGNYSDLSGTPSSLPASDVYSWAKAATKPSYTASEVGALASDGTAAKATADADGNNISSTYMKKGVDRVTAGQYSGATLGYCATSEGQGNRATGNTSHAQGMGTESAANYSHSEGYDTHVLAGADAGHAEGYGVAVEGRAAHGEGYGTLASSDYQHVEGKWNVEDDDNIFAHIIGGGTANYDRKNIFTVDWNGDVNAGRSNGLTNDTKLPTGADVINYMNSNLAQVASSTSKTITTGGVTATVYFLKHKNGIKHLKIEASDFPTAQYVTGSGFIPDAYKATQSNQNQFFAGMNNQYTSTSNVDRTRMVAISNNQGILYIYGSPYPGLWIDAFYV